MELNRKWAIIKNKRNRLSVGMCSMKTVFIQHIKRNVKTFLLIKRLTNNNRNNKWRMI